MNSTYDLNWPKLKYHPLQSKLWRTKSQYAAAACGRGSGKTELARRRIVRYLAVKKPWPNPLYYYGLPTYPQARRVAWPELLRLIPASWITDVNRSEMKVTTIFGSTLYVGGLDKPQRVEGLQWDGVVVDEASDQRPGVFDLSFRPALTHRRGWFWLIGVPKRMGIGAKSFKEFYSRDDVDSYTWPSSDILPADVILDAKRNMDPRSYAEQFEADWVSAGGSIHYAFDSVLNVSNAVQYDPTSPLIIGSDFNVDPMSWVVCQVRTSETGKGCSTAMRQAELEGQAPYKAITLSSRMTSGSTAASITRKPTRYKLTDSLVSMQCLRPWTMSAGCSSIQDARH